MDNLTAFGLAAFALIASPGPNTLSLAATGAAFGARAGLAYLFGLVAGMVLVMLVTASGLLGLLLALPGLAPVLTAVVAGYFLWLAFRIATAPPLGEAAGQRRPPSFAAGTGLSLINPKAYAAMAALFSGFVLVDGRLLLDTAAKIVLLAVIITLVNVAWLCAGSSLRRLFRWPLASRLLNVAFALLLLASLVLVLR